MANPACMSQDGREAVFVGTMLQTGDGFTLCDECLVAWAAGLLNLMTGIDPTPFLAAISDDGEGDAAAADRQPGDSSPPGDQDPDPPPLTARGGRSRRGSAAAPTATDDGDGTPSTDADVEPPAA